MTQPWKSKFRNQPVVTDEGRFASKKEYARWCHLKLREKAGEISKLERQVRMRFEHGGVHICDYVCDFVYFEKGVRVWEDVKGVRTPVFSIKAKLARAFYGVEVREV